MTRWEYATTTGRYWWERDMSGGSTVDARPPDPPDGDGWRLKSTAAADGILFFTWERDLDELTAPERSSA